MKRHDDSSDGYRAIVQRVHEGKAIVAMETAGCSSCGQGANCSIGRLAGGRPATLVALPTELPLRPGDEVRVVLSAARVNRSALLGYFFPALAMLAGAGLGAAVDGRDLAAAIGAIAGLLLALAVTRVLSALLPSLMPTPRLVPIPASRPFPTSSQEFSHER